jgi:hypothetical protein
MDDRDGRHERGDGTRDGPSARDLGDPSDDRDPDDPPGVHPRTQDALLDHYAEMRADARSEGRTRSRRLGHGLLAVAVVLALAYVEPGRPWVVAAVPVVLTLLFVAAVAAENRTARRTRQVVAVERLLDVPGLDYEHEYGPLSVRGGRLRDQLLTYALAGCFLVLWLGSMAAGLVEFHEDPPTVAGWAVSAAIPAVVYLVLVAMVTVSAWTFLATRSEHRVAAHRAGRDGTYAQRRLDEFVGGEDDEADGESVDDEVKEVAGEDGEDDEASDETDDEPSEPVGASE